MNRIAWLIFVALITAGIFSSTAFADSDKGQGVYMNFCSSCHGSGIAGAPKVGDKEAWAPRIAQGMETLNEHSINGYQGEAGYMPPKGGNSALTDAEVMAAVKYMVEQSQ